MQKVASGPPGSRMRDCMRALLELDKLVFDHVVRNNLLGGRTTNSNIKKDAVEAFKVLKEKGQVPADKKFVASNGFLATFKRCYNLASHIRCGESSSGDLDGVQLAREALPKILA